ncbi:hypothetical protein SNEBB_003208 [Seison nebaliae]|nr:hypothetical protein SNEBB_003208 [Seison nebaliae]
MNSFILFIIYVPTELTLALILQMCKKKRCDIDLMSNIPKIASSSSFSFINTSNQQTKLMINLKECITVAMETKETGKIFFETRRKCFRIKYLSSPTIDYSNLRLRSQAVGKYGQFVHFYKPSHHRRKRAFASYDHQKTPKYGISFVRRRKGNSRFLFRLLIISVIFTILSLIAVAFISVKALTVSTRLVRRTQVKEELYYENIRAVAIVMGKKRKFDAYVKKNKEKNRIRKVRHLLFREATKQLYNLDREREMFRDMLIFQFPNLQLSEFDTFLEIHYAKRLKKLRRILDDLILDELKGK